MTLYYDERHGTLIDTSRRHVFVDEPRFVSRRKQDRRSPDDVRPPVDWTGHQYKAVSELKVNYGHVGRDRLVGQPTIPRREGSNT